MKFLFGGNDFIPCVYDLELHSKTTGPQKYRILTTKTPNEIAHTWAGEAQPFNHFMKETRERTSQKELRY